MKIRDPIVASAAFLSNLDVLIQPGLLDPATCRALRAEMRHGVTKPATLLAAEGGSFVSRTIRRAALCRPPPARVRQIQRRARAMIAGLSAHFRVQLRGVERPAFITYRRGDFYVAHTDSARGRHAPARARARRVSMVVFLTGESKRVGESTHVGGSLVLYDILGNRRDRHRRWSIKAEVGLAVAFRADTLHEVTPVVAGRRRTVALWFY